MSLSNGAFRVLVLMLILLLGVFMEAGAEDKGKKVLDLRAALEGALEEMLPLQAADQERATWQRKLEDAKQKERKGRNMFLIGLVGGVGLSLIGPFTGTAKTTWAGIGLTGFGLGYGLPKYNRAKVDRTQLEAEGRAKGYLSFYTPPEPQFVVTLSF